MDVTGGMENLELTLGSEPQMETADILSYIATGRPAASAADFGDISRAGTSLALGTVADVLEEEAGQRIGLDVVEIRQDGLDGATLIAGRYVSPRLYVGFQQPLTLNESDEGIEKSGESTQVEIEYAAWRWLLLNLQAGQSEFRWFFRTRKAF
jgi:translocation and assembly module TamB